MKSPAENTAGLFTYRAFTNQIMPNGEMLSSDVRLKPVIFSLQTNHGEFSDFPRFEKFLGKQIQIRRPLPPVEPHRQKSS